MNKATSAAIEQLRESLPNLFPIDEQKLFSPKTIHNLVSMGRGPELVHLRGKRFLEKESFLSWLTENENRGKRRGRKKAK